MGFEQVSDSPQEEIWEYWDRRQPCALHHNQRSPPLGTPPPILQILLRGHIWTTSLAPGDLVGKRPLWGPVRGRGICTGLRHSGDYSSGYFGYTVTQAAYKTHPEAAQSPGTSPILRKLPSTAHGEGQGPWEGFA